MNTFFLNPNIIVSHWVPMGINNLVTLNRHLGSHKEYQAPTAFGMNATIADLHQGQFKMKNKGSLLRTLDYKSAKYVRTELISRDKTAMVKGLEVNKDGDCYIGLDFSEKISINDLKLLISGVEDEFVDEFLSILTETQISLLRSSFGLSKQESFKKNLSSYALIITESLGHKIESSAYFISEPDNLDLLTPLTDWITDHFSYKNSHVFIGVKAMVCVGKPDPELQKTLKHIIFLKTMFNLSSKLYTIIWQNMKSLDKIGNKITDSNYNSLKTYNYQLTQLQNTFSRQKIVYSQISKALENKKDIFQSTEGSKIYADTLINEIKDEIEKTNDRQTITNQMSIDLQALRDQLQQRISLIMTKSGQRLNLILLVLTVISVMSIGEILGFSTNMLILVCIIVVPFILISIRSYIQYRRDFRDDL